MFEKIKIFITKTVRFLTYDIWRVDPDSKSSRMLGLYNAIKAFILAIKNINGAQLNTRAAALTYSSLLSVVPLLAVLFAIARGFGLQNIVQSELFNFFEGQQSLLAKGMSFIDASLEYAQNGVFVGIGVALLLYTVINLFSNIEDNFNTIWLVKKGRTYYRMFIDYLALFLIAPVFVVLNAGLSIFLTSATELELVGLVISPILKVIPFVITVLLFTFIYSYIPNTRVKFTSALFGGFFAGLSFQIFQMLYIGGQIWIAKYNTIYGSFAALPLFLLWLQLSWFICLFGAELAFAYQNVKKFSFEHETNNISRRYKDFVILMITTLIVKRFVDGTTPYTADELSEKYKIPTQLTSDILYLLQEVDIIAETPSDDERIAAYIPAIDIHKITVNYVFDKIDLYGSEDFIIDTQVEFKSEWNTILEIREVIHKKEKMLLKDL